MENRCCKCESFTTCKSKNKGTDFPCRNYSIGDILCCSCAAYGECKSQKKNYALKCQNFWEHRPTSDFIKHL